MTKEEFLFEHTIEMVIDLINRHFEFHGAKDPEQTEVTKETNNPREFFAI